MKVRHVLEEFEETAVLGTRAVRQFLTASEPSGKRAEKSAGSYNKARIGVGAMASYARLRATVANEQALRLMELREGRSLKLVGSGSQKRLTA